MNKRGMSNVVTNVLLILLAIGVIGIIAFSVNTFVKNKSIEDVQVSLNCISDVDIELLNVCYNGNLLKMEIKNNKDIYLGDFFLVRITFENGSRLSVPTPYNTQIGPYQTKIVNMKYYQDTQNVRVIPQIESQNFLCFEGAPEFLNVEECV